MADPTATLNPVKKDPNSDVDDDDNVPLALSKKTHKPKSVADKPLTSVSNKTTTTKKKLDIKQEGKPFITKKEPKKETGSDVDDEEEGPISLLRKKKPTNNLKVPNGKASTKGVQAEGKKPPKVKEEKVYDDEFELEKPLKKVRKEEVKRKKKKMSSREMSAANGKVKKVYSLPGQKVDPPEERDPLRIFYETLHQQVPNSEMAAVWMMERGLLPEKEAAIIYAKKQKRKQQQQIKSPGKVVSASKVPRVSATKPKEEPKASPKKPKVEPKESSSAKSKSKPTKKRKSGDDSEAEDDDDDDFVLPLKKMRK